ncbi:PREDICTED: WUSCHEL-related homeobox 5-like [Nelumbo nucifera]|uniref:WUSCHEL-related homeobox 5-like n=2 Tax=Nelumbo nucifera TaxID=4432 RepID=A0A1U8A857_NELNU|nr:PREDICTED: WUSCHEL-related homeobox 5-like [Nelumbo nucifera]DAD28437.1 TPA_asm: hypothetical protein HUJ06_029905 [Nelumbo nucifera]
MDERMLGFCIRAGGYGYGGGGCHAAGGGGGGTKCGRWNPTAEQVKVLTDLFKSGLRTPSTDQIQKISTQLSFYGKIESKNVFYWFQNHKARERQKRKRVSVDDQDFIDRAVDKVLPATKHFVEVDLVSEPERTIETLQLFPLNSYQDSDSLKLRLFRNEYKETTFSYGIGKENDHPPLDLRLSFL